MDQRIDEKMGQAISNEGAQNGVVTSVHLLPEEDKRILRKLDLWQVPRGQTAEFILRLTFPTSLLPIMAVSYFFQYLDKSALGSTAILGLREDLHLTGEEYSWATGIYYFGYLFASYPAGIMMIRWRVGKVITVSM